MALLRIPCLPSLCKGRSRGVYRRLASTSSNPLPFPSHPNPTAHQIFHLPVSASQDDVKARYYDLVRIYHPDSPISRSLGPEVAQSRFQAISSAYNTLRGISSDPGSSDAGARKDYHNLSTEMWKARQRQRAELDVGMDDRWKDRIFLGSVLLAIGAFVAQTFVTRREAMRDAVHTSRMAQMSSVNRSSKTTRELDEGLLAAPDPRTEEIHR